MGPCIVTHWHSQTRVTQVANKWPHARMSQRTSLRGGHKGGMTDELAGLLLVGLYCLFCSTTYPRNPNPSFRFRKAAWSRLSAFVQKSSWAAWHTLFLHDCYRDGQLVAYTDSIPFQVTCAPAYSEVPRMERAARQNQVWSAGIVDEFHTVGGAAWM